MSVLSCRFCARPLEQVVVDLGMSPLANSYVEPSRVLEPEPFLPLKVFVCDGCYLVQLPECATPESIFSDYAYFSSFSDSWLEHCKRYVEHVVTRFGLGAKTPVVELASNDGYLLRYVKQHGVPVLGVEPARNVAAEADKVGVPTLVRFFGTASAPEVVERVGQASLVIGNNVLAHVPDLNDFVAGMKQVLAADGVITMEFPHLLRLYENNQFDTIYHEHFSYLSLAVVERIFAHHGLRLFDVDEIETHGGSLRIYADHIEGAAHEMSDAVARLRERESREGLDRLARHASFGERVRATKRRLLDYLIRAKEEGKSIAGYGAAAKGNTLFNYCGIGTDFIDYVVDRSPHKQGKLLPGTRIPIHAPERLAETRPDLVFILPWNIKEEITGQMAHVREWGGKFVVAIPEVLEL